MTKHLTLRATALLYHTTFFRDLRTLIRGESVGLHTMSMSGCLLERRTRGNSNHCMYSNHSNHCIQFQLETGATWTWRALQDIEWHETESGQHQRRNHMQLARFSLYRSSISLGESNLTEQSALLHQVNYNQWKHHMKILTHEIHFSVIKLKPHTGTTQTWFHSSKPSHGLTPCASLHTGLPWNWDKCRRNLDVSI